MTDEQRRKNREYRRRWRDANWDKERAWRERNKARIAEYNRNWRKKNLSRASANVKRWFAKNPDKALGYALKKYGISVEEFKALLEQQAGGCAVCGLELPYSKKGLNIDHCHTTGRVRGLLCRTCNLGIGNFFDDPVRLRAAAEYLEKSR